MEEDKQDANEIQAIDQAQVPDHEQSSSSSEANFDAATTVEAGPEAAEDILLNDHISDDN